jgi:hypothetical protein
MVVPFCTSDGSPRAFIRLRVSPLRVNGIGVLNGSVPITVIVPDEGKSEGALSSVSTVSPAWAAATAAVTVGTGVSVAATAALGVTVGVGPPGTAVDVAVADCSVAVALGGPVVGVTLGTTAVGVVLDSGAGVSVGDGGGPLATVIKPFTPLMGRLVSPSVVPEGLITCTL